jgi:hypothetical protein
MFLKATIDQSGSEDESPIAAHELQLDELGHKLWVHAPDGSTVGRFNVRFGIDIRNTVTDQIAGAEECLFCTHTPPTRLEWELFKSRAFELWGVTVPDTAVDVSLLADEEDLPGPDPSRG